MENGPFKEYHTNGRLYAEGVYKNEKEEGVVHIYDSLGVHIKDVFYEQGFPKKIEEIKKVVSFLLGLLLRFLLRLAN